MFFGLCTRSLSCKSPSGLSARLEAGSRLELEWKHYLLIAIEGYIDDLDLMKKGIMVATIKGIGIDFLPICSYTFIPHSNITCRIIL